MSLYGSARAPSIGRNPVGLLTDSAGGTASTTIAAAGASYSQTNENNFRSSVAKHINDLINKLNERVGS